ncbi:MAG: precorrin-2 C(20)-methyltransferase [Actinomycetota bacterium]
MRKSSVYLPDGLKKRLGALAARTGRSEAELIREALEQRLGTAERVRPADPAVPGRLVGVGVGPGPADLVTVRALDALRRADRVVAPCTSIDAVGRAEAIIRDAAPDVVVERLVFVMAPDHAARAAALADACDRIAGHLDDGEEVAFITLGDPNLYSTVSTVVAGVVARRPATEVATIAGITAFQALAMAGEVVLTDEQQTLVLLPASAPSEAIDAELARSDRTVILYKGGGRLAAVADQLEAAARLDDAVLGELIGMPGERVAPVADIRDRPASYLSAVISPAPEGAGPVPMPAETDGTLT